MLQIGRHPHVCHFESMDGTVLTYAMYGLQKSEFFYPTQEDSSTVVYKSVYKPFEIILLIVCNLREVQRK